MKKYCAFVFVCIFTATLCSGCGPSQEEKKEEVRKNIMGDGNKPMPKKSIGGL